MEISKNENIVNESGIDMSNSYFINRRPINFYNKAIFEREENDMLTNCQDLINLYTAYTKNYKLAMEGVFQNNTPISIFDSDEDVNYTPLIKEYDVVALVDKKRNFKCFGIYVGTTIINGDTECGLKEVHKFYTIKDNSVEIIYWD